jgi:hypothetical protein
MSNTAAPSPSRFDTFVADHTDFLSHSDTTDPPNTECPVCVEGIQEHICVKIINIDGCKHLIGLECLKAMFEHMPDAEKKCPLCRIQWAEVATAPANRIRTDTIENLMADLAAMPNHLGSGRVHGQNNGNGGRGSYLGVEVQYGGPRRDVFVNHTGSSRRPAASREASSRPVRASDRPTVSARPITTAHPTATPRPTTPARPTASSRHAVPPRPAAPSRNGGESVFNPLYLPGMLRPVPIPEIPDIMPFPAHAFSQPSHSWVADLRHATDSRAARHPAQDVFGNEFMRHFFGIEEQEARGGRGTPRSDRTPRGDRGHRHSEGRRDHRHGEGRH